MRRGIACGLAAALLLAMTVSAVAGQACEQTPPDAASVTRGLALAEAVQRSLDASGAQVVILAREGQDLTRYGLTYSHLAFAYRETIPVASLDTRPLWKRQSSPPAASDATKTVWRVAHKLNTCGTAQAAIYRQGLGDFFLDKPFRYDAAYVVPAAEVQAALLPVLRDDQRLVQLHTSAYSVVAYPWATRYQQSNQWALETLAGALEPAVADRWQAQAWLQLHAYQPTVLRIDAVTRLGARMTKANVAFDDHPNAQRFTDRIATVTVESMFTWMQHEGIAGPPVVVR